MDLETYRARRLAAAKRPDARRSCPTCRQPDGTCYCEAVRPFDCSLTFAILNHPQEARRRIATGRFSHLCIRGSHLLRGVDFSEDVRVTRLLADPSYHAVVLAPGPHAVDLTPMKPKERRALFPAGVRPLIFVVDGTWATANKILRLSHNVRALPRVCFTPSTPSQFSVRLQPRAHCYSTAEAIHETIRLLGTEAEAAAAENLLEVQAWMVQRELEYRRGQRSGRLPPYRDLKRPGPDEFA